MNNKQLLKNRIFYGFGVVGITIFDTFIGSFLTLYVTDVLGLDALYFASLLIVPKIVDVVIDFFIIYFVGKTRTRFGMYRPWLLNMIAMVIALITIFSVPFFNLSNTVILAIIVISYFICSSICDSFYWISYKAMPGVMTENENELVKLSSSKTIFDYVFSVLTSALTMPILMTFGSYDGDFRNPTGWLVAALIFGTISLVFSLLCFIFVKTDLDLEKKMTKDYSIKDIFSDYKYILQNKHFVLFAILLFLVNLAIYTNQSVSYYFYIYNLGIEKIISYIMLIAVVFTAIALPITSKLHDAIGLNNSLIIGAVCFILSAICMMLAHNVFMVIVMGFFLVTGTTILTTLLFSSWAIIAKNMNQKNIKTPLNSIIGASNIIGSFGIIIGDTLGAAIITYSKYNPNLAIQDGFTLNTFRYFSPIFMIILSLIMIMILIYLNKKEVNKQNESIR